MSAQAGVWLREPGGAAALIDPECGGTVRRLQLHPVSAPGSVRSDRYAPGPVEVLRKAAEHEPERCHTEWFHGCILMPFADRIPAGRYRWRGREYQLPINDTEHGDAIHGFLYRCPLERVDGHGATDGRPERSLRLSTVSAPCDGYPWSLRVELTYTLLTDRFTLRFRVRNLAESPAPFCAGWHPYFSVPGEPTAPIDSARLRVAADRYLEVDDNLRLSGATPSVDGSRYDFRTPRTIGAEDLDIALTVSPGADTATDTDTERDAIVLAGPRRTIGVEMGGAYANVQLFIPPDRRAIAIEPISAPGAAFTDPSLGLITIEPGATVDGWARVTLR